MRTRSSVWLCLVGTTTLLLSCSRTDTSTQVTVAFESEAKVPKELGKIEVTVTNSQGKVTYDQVFSADTSDQFAAGGFLPATLAVIPTDDNSVGEPFSVAVRAWTSTDPDHVAIERRAVVTYVEGRTLLLPMPLRMSCLGVSKCSGETTCIGGTCMPNRIDATSLPDFEPRLVLPEAAIGACFDEGACLAQPSKVTVASDCTFPLPAGDAVNVAVQWKDGAGRIIVLESSAIEGWSRVDAVTGKMSPGVCAAVGASGGDASVLQDFAIDAWVSTACPTKRANQAFCRENPHDDVGVGANL